MKKILVTTDLSKNSRSGIRFAIQLASQNGAILVFYHVIKLLKPTRWNDRRFEKFSDDEVQDARRKLETFVKDVYRATPKKPGNYTCVIQVASKADTAIIDYAVEGKFDFICMSTRGAGVLRRLVGTLTSAVLKKSQIPVLAIPKNYRRAPIKSILYSSDLNSLDQELKTVKEFATSVKAKISVLHYDYLQQVQEINDQFENIVKRHRRSGVQFYFRKFQIENSLAAHLKTAVMKLKPSIIVLFTKQDRDWFEKVFLSSKSAQVTFDTQKPILIFSKTSK